MDSEKEKEKEFEQKNCNIPICFTQPILLTERACRGAQRLTIDKISPAYRADSVYITQQVVCRHAVTAVSIETFRESISW